MWSNVDSWEVWAEGQEVCFSFLDIFGEGETYKFPRTDTAELLMALAQTLAEIAGDP